MSDKKKQLLEEAAVRKFMKIAGTGKLSDTFFKKTLKEETTGRGKIFDPHGDDPRHENLNEEEVTEESADLEEEVTEEGTDLEEEVQEEGEVQEESEAKTSKKGGAGKNIAGGKGLSGAGKKPTAKMQYEAQGSIVSKGPGKAIESGKGMSGSGKKVSAKMQYEEVQEEGDQLQEFDDMEGGGPPDMGGDTGLPPEVGAEEPMGGAGDLQGLVQAIAAAISAHTGVQVSVEGGEGGEPDLGGEEDLPPPDMGGEEEAPVEEPPMQETGNVSYKTEDPKARQMTAGAMQEAKKKASAKAAQKQKDQIVEAITKNVLAKLSGAIKKKTK